MNHLGPRIPPGRTPVRRVRPVLAGALMAGALFVPSQAYTPPTHPLDGVPTPPRIGGAVIEAWAFGTLADARQPNTESACDLSHVCALAIASDGGVATGTGATIKAVVEPPPQGELPPNLPFTLEESIDYAHPVNKDEDTGITCYPANGALAITDGVSTLNLGIVGQVCQTSENAAQVVFSGSYFTVAPYSGEFAIAEGVGTVNINNPSGLPGSGTSMKASIAGQLKYWQ